MKTYKTNIANYSIKKNKTNIKKVKITSSKEAQDYIRNFYHEDIGVYESFYLLCFNNSNNTTGYVKISQGGIMATIVDIRVVLKYAIESLATAVIIAHNHPSGTLRPSEADKTITHKLKKALEYHDIKLHDHIILAPEKDAYLSFADEGIL